EKPALCPMIVANAWPTGPSISPITISGSVHSQSWLPSPIASPKRILIRSGMTVPPWWLKRGSSYSRVRGTVTPNDALEWPAMERAHFRLGFAGFGHVGRALARLLVDRREEIERRYGLTFTTTLLASARRGALVSPGGIDLEAALRDGWSSSLSLLQALATAP